MFYSLNETQELLNIDNFKNRDTRIQLEFVKNHINELLTNIRSLIKLTPVAYNTKKLCNIARHLAQTRNSILSETDCIRTADSDDDPFPNAGILTNPFTGEKRVGRVRYPEDNEIERVADINAFYPKTSGEEMDRIDELNETDSTDTASQKEH